MELNCGRIEARALVRFEATSEQVCFPHVRVAARLAQASDSLDGKRQSDSVVYLPSNRREDSAEQMLDLKRRYWSIENGPHQMLDGSRLCEDKSRVRLRNNVLNLGMFRRLAIALGTHWISRQKNKRKATFNGFLGAMDKNGSATPFRMALCANPDWLP